MGVAALGGFRAVFANAGLRKLSLAYGIAITSELAYLVALGVYAYEVGGALAVGIVGTIRMAPAALATPFAAMLGDRYRRERLLLVVSALGAFALAASAGVLQTDASETVVYALAAVHALAVTLFRPALNALMPSLARSPEELVASNGVALTLESAGTLAGPVLGGAAVALADPGTAFAIAAAGHLAALLMLTGLRVEGRLETRQNERGIVWELLAGLRLGVTEPGPRLILALVFAQTVVRGALNVMIVVVAFRLLGEGGGWVGLLTAAFGVGGLVGAVAAVGLVGRPLARPVGLALVLWGAPIAFLALGPHEASALLLIGLVGIGNSIEDVAAFTLLQRIVPDALLARFFGVVWSVAALGVALGSLAAPALVAVLGPRSALVATGCVLPALVLLTWSRLRAIDRAAAAPSRELELLRLVPMFAPLPVVAKEHMAARLVRLRVPAGAEIIREGDAGDRFYVLAGGQAVVTKGGRHVVDCEPGDYFGEIALLRDVPRTATVTAVTDVELYAVDRRDFLAAVGGHSAGAEAAEAVVEQRLAGSGAPL